MTLAGRPTSASSPRSCAGANPNWPEKDVFDLLALHLKLTKDETVARITSDWAADVGHSTTSSPRSWSSPTRCTTASSHSSPIGSGWSHVSMTSLDLVGGVA